MELQNVTQTPPAVENPQTVSERIVRPLTNIAETEDAYRLELLVPGVAKGALNVQVERGELRLSAPTSFGAPEGLRAVSREFAPATFERRFRLPDEVDVERIEAKLANGVLHLTLPKREAVKARSIAIS
ncbi:MAG: Hsp20/alpha crystallin family protein [Myxococcota bacterium]